MTYSNNEKAAIVCLLIELINADGAIVPEEQYTLNVVNEELGITQALFDAGKLMDCSYAMTVVRLIEEDDKKTNIAVLMVRIIDCDGKATPEEIKMLNTICRQTGLDTVILTQKPKDKLK